MEITSNAKRVSASFEKLVETLVDNIVKEGIHDTLPIIANGARRDHRHIRRTGKLERSIKSIKLSDGGEVYTDDVSCKYGKYVHMGQRSWAPDQFLFDSFTRNERILDQKIERSIEKSLRRAGF